MLKPEKQQKECEDCAGEGHYVGLSTVEDPCETCGGDGVVEAPQEDAERCRCVYEGTEYVEVDFGKRRLEPDRKREAVTLQTMEEALGALIKRAESVPWAREYEFVLEDGRQIEIPWGRVEAHPDGLLGCLRDRDIDREREEIARHFAEELRLTLETDPPKIFGEADWSS